MKYPVLIENGEKDKYTAVVVGLPDCRAEATTQEEAVAKVQAALQSKLRKSELVWVHVDESATDHSWLKHAGRLENNPLFEIMLAAVADHRRDIDDNVQ
jgi:hypothetical protein